MHDYDDYDDYYEEGYEDGYCEGRRNRGPKGTQAVIERNRRRNQENGCYIATCVYGSYDCPEVWTLRRFRDDYLAKSRPGRGFIRCYYAVSPWLVKHFGSISAIRKSWKALTDLLVKKLADRGVEDTPYQDP